MSLVVPHVWTAGDDALSSYLQTLTDGLVQQQGGTPTATGTVLDMAELRQTVTQNTTTGTWTAITFDIEDSDLANGHSTVTNTSRYVCQTSGRLTFECGATIAANGTGLRGLRFLKNGTTPLQGRDVRSPAPAANTTEMTITRTIPLVAGDYIELQVRQDSGGTLATVYASPDTGCFMNVRHTGRS